MMFWNKLSTKAMVLAYGAKQRAKDFMEDEHGLAGVVVAVLLILIAVLAIVFLWSSLSDWLSDLWTKIIGNESEFKPITPVTK